MTRRLPALILCGLIILLATWYFIAPLYKHSPVETQVATILKPSTPLKANFLRGHWTLLFFGYMTCPEICPRTLGIVRDAWNKYPNQKIPARFVFSNITPSDPKDLQTFLHNYHESFQGMTADNKDMQYLYDQLGIFAEEQGEEINHTAALMLIDPQGRLNAVFTPPFTAQELVEDLNIITQG